MLEVALSLRLIAMRWRCANALVVGAVLLAISGCSAAGNSTSCSAEIQAVTNANDRAAKASSTLSSAADDLANHPDDMRKVAALVRAATAESRILASAANAYQDLADVSVDAYAPKAAAVASKLKKTSPLLEKLATSGAGYTIGLRDASSFNAAAADALWAMKSVPVTLQTATQAAKDLDGNVCQ